MITWISAFLHTGGLTTLWAWLAVCGLCLQLLRLKNWGALSPIAWTLLALSALVVLNPLLPGNRIPAVSWEIAVKLLCLPAGFWLARQSPAHSALHRHLGWTLLIVAAAALLEFAFTRRPPYALLADPNALSATWNAAIFSTLGVVLAAATASIKDIEHRFFALIGVYLLCLAVSQSLSGQLSFLLGLTLFYGFGVFGKVRHVHKAGAALLIVFCGLVAATSAMSDIKKDNLDRALAPAGDGSVQYRLSLIESAWQIYLTEPLTGTGLGSFKLLYPRYRSPLETSSSGDLVHNDYVQLLQEGGPLLPLALIAVGIAALIRLYRLLLNTQTTAETRALALGHATAAACIFFHAAFNFIVYVMPLALLLGYQLGRLDALSPGGGRVAATGSRVTPRLRMARAGVTVVLVLVSFSLGLRALFAGITGLYACERKFCTNLAADARVTGQLAVFLAATQPSWLLSSDHIVSRLSPQIDAATGEERERAVSALRDELLGMIRAVPDVGYPYFRLAELLERAPSVAISLPNHLPADAIGLYRMAVERQPQDYNLRIALVEAMVDRGQHREALRVLDEEGMVWWSMPNVTLEQRGKALSLLVSLHAELGLCTEAAEAENALEGFNLGAKFTVDSPAVARCKAS